MNILQPNKLPHLNIKQITQLLGRGKIGVMPTDTIYGIVGSALNPKVVEKIYKLRKRAQDKPMIILIASLNDLNKFNIKITNSQKKFLKNVWPNPVSVILPCTDRNFEYLHKGKNSLAFRMPKQEKLLKILKNVGPLVAPSANFEGEKPSQNIADATSYFGKRVAFYQDEGVIHDLPSTLVDLTTNSIKILRQGSFKI